MTISAVAVDEIIKASTHNQLIANVNSSPGRAIFTANGTWSVPDGVHQFKVYLAGGGGAGGTPTGDGFGGILPGGRGGNSPLISALFAGVALGTTFNVVIGAGAGVGANGGTSGFGPVMQCTGGQVGSVGGLAIPVHGIATFPPGAPEIYHTNELFTHPGLYAPGYGSGGFGESGGPYGYPATLYGDTIGSQGICVIEW